MVVAAYYLCKEVELYPIRIRRELEKRISNHKIKHMKELTPGHRYSAANFEDKEAGQIIQFIHKEPVICADDGSTELKTISDGTTNEEVLAILIHRMDYLNNKFPCRENSLAITNLEQALMWLEKRTSNRKIRGVEGKHIK